MGTDGKISKKKSHSLLQITDDNDDGTLGEGPALTLLPYSPSSIFIVITVMVSLGLGVSESMVLFPGGVADRFGSDQCSLDCLPRVPHTTHWRQDLADRQLTRFKKANIRMQHSKETLRAQLLEQVPDWVAACEDSATDTVIMHQSAFGSDHRQSEIELLGWAVKYAGMCGKNISILAI